MSSPIEDYALIGDGQTTALVNSNGSIDWSCWPQFDGDACFAALLGTAENGRWLIAPQQPGTTTRRYRGDTLVLETEMEGEGGTIRIGFERVLAYLDEDEDKRARLAALRDKIHAEVISEGFNDGLQSFTQTYGSQVIDASLLILPLVGFLPADDPRMAATVTKVREVLDEGGLIRRKKVHADGGNEGAFLACSCWKADCLNMQGRHDEAIAQFERVLEVANDVGLFSEEFNVPGKHLAGNFPQALTHLAVINTALGLCGPVLDRGGA